MLHTSFWLKFESGSPWDFPQRPDRSARFQSSSQGRRSWTCPEGNLRQSGEVDAAKILARQLSERTPRTCANATVNLGCVNTI